MTAFVKVALAALLVVHLVSASKNHLHKRARRQGDQRPAYTQQGTYSANSVCVVVHNSRVLSCMYICIHIYSHKLCVHVKLLYCY